MQNAQTNDVTLDGKMNLLRRWFEQAGSVLVCFSGGLDSAFVLAVAHEVLGDRAVALTATGPALAPSEYDEARAIAARLGVRHELHDAGEMQQPGYVANEPDRCFHCKSALYVLAHRLQQQLGLACVVNGTNVDDLGDYRPGLQAAEQASVRSPLLDVGMAKSEVREAARAMGLEVWAKPAAACLASRIPYGTPVTAERLAQVAGFEAALRALGLAQVRVRHHGTLARIEVAPDRVAETAADPLRQSIVDAGRRHGFTYVTVDLAGYRTGSHNEVLRGRHLRTVG